MKKNCLLFLMLFTLILSACGNVAQQSNSENLSLASGSNSIPSASEEDLGAAEEEARTAFANLREEYETGSYHSFGNKNGKILEDIFNANLENKVVANYYYMSSAMFWNDALSGMSSSDENYNIFIKNFEEAIASIDITVDDVHTDFIEEFITSTIGMDRYVELRPELTSKQDTSSSLTKEDQIEILVYIMGEEEKYGENLTNENTEEIWKDTCERFNITQDCIFSLMQNIELVKEASSMLHPNSETSTQEATGKIWLDNPERASEAWVCAQDIVNHNLKSPETAKFCSYPEATIQWDGNREYKILGYVNAQNGFGASVPTCFEVTLTLTESGYENGNVTFDE